MLRKSPKLRRFPALVILAALLALAARPNATRADDAGDSGLRVSASPARVVASPTLMWSFELRVANEGHGGFYADSVSCRIEDTGPGETHASRVEVFPMSALALSLGSMSDGDSSVVQQSVPATFETGVISYRIWGHRSDGTIVAAESPRLQLAPGPVSEEHPSEFLEVGGHKVEYVIFRSAKEGDAPGLLFVHPEGTHARQQFQTGMQYAARGYTVMLVSLPGYGLSEGRPDELGDVTLAALGAAYDQLAKTPGVDPRRIAAWGVSKGAGAVARLAGNRKSLAAVVLQSGIYDDRTSARGSGAKSVALILHGDADPVAPVARARSLAAAWGGAGVESKFAAGAGHELPRAQATRDIAAFLQAKLQK